jgi:uncharacterized repeat protein (TIGR01451 family)
MKVRVLFSTLLVVALLSSTLAPLAAAQGSSTAPDSEVGGERKPETKETVGEYVAPTRAGLRGFEHEYEWVGSQAIPDAACPSMTTILLNIPDSFIINDVRVGFNALHTWRSDIQLWVMSPQGTMVNLFLNQDGSADNFDVLFEDGGGPVDSTNHDVNPPYYEYSWAPVSPLVAFVGEDALGNWELQICDAAGGDIGSVERWALLFNQIPSPDLSESFKEVWPAKAEPGDVLTYTVQIINSGDAPALNAVMTDVIPTGTSYVPDSVTCDYGTCWYEPADDAVYWTGQINAMLLGHAPPTPAGGSQVPRAALTDLRDAQHTVVPGTAGAGLVIENFPNTWMTSTIGLVYNPATDFVNYAHEITPSVWTVDYPVPHNVLGSLDLAALNPGFSPALNPRDGAAYDAAIDTYLMSDFQGGLGVADDNIIEIDAAGTILNAWETDGASNDSYDGSIINNIIDMAVAPGAPTRYFVSAAFDDSVVYEIELIKTGAWWTPATWGTITTWPVPGIDDNVGIDYDAENGVLYHSDFNSTNIVVTDLDGNVLDAFTCDSPAGYNTGVTYIEGKAVPEVWVTDFGSNSTTRCKIAQPATVSFQVVTDEAVCGDVVVNEAVITDPEAPDVVMVQAETLVIPSLYYMEDFEADDGGYGGTGEWEWGVPTYGPPNAHSGMNVWGTDLDSDYENDADWVLTKTLDLPADPNGLWLQWWEWYDIESCCDDGWVEINGDVLHDAYGTSDGWVHSMADVSVYAGQTVTLTFHFESDYSVVRAGWYIDDVAIHGACAGPDIVIDPTSLHSEQCPDEQVTLDLSVCNAGDQWLDWNVIEMTPTLALQAEYVTIEVPAFEPVDNPAAKVGPPGAQPRQAFGFTIAAPGLSLQTYDVLLVSPDSTGGDISVLLATLGAYGDLNVTVWDNTQGNPTPADMAPYGVVFIGNDVTWDSEGLDKVVIGNAVADYIDGGGKVVESLYVQSFDQWGFAGRYMTDGYSPFTPASLDNWNPDTMNILEPMHPVMAGVTSIGDNWGHQNPGLAPDAMLLAGWSSSGYNAVAVNDDVVALNQLIFSAADWTGDVGILLHNAIVWLAEEPVSVDFPWVSEVPTQGLVFPGECMPVEVTFASSGLEPGDYAADLIIHSNDPDTPTTTLNTSLTVLEPVAIVDVTYVITDLQVTFDATVSGDEPISFAWDFGDGNTSDLEDPTHTYDEGGCYTVTLEASNECGVDVWSAEICVCDPAAIVDVTYVIADLEVTFDATVSGDEPISFAWDFGDDNTSDIEDPIHTYAAGGCYTVTLEVSNECGTDVWSDEVCVEEPVYYYYLPMLYKNH